MIKNKVLKILISLAIGLIAGISSAIFLLSLDWITSFRTQHPNIIFCLPLAGIFISWCYQKLEKNASGGMPLIINELKKPQKRISALTAPFIFFSTLLTHLFGGSAGREGTALQMATALIPKQAFYFFEDKRTPILMGISAGFGAVFGTPLAGIFFSLEIVKLNNKLRIKTLPFITISAYFADWICQNIPFVKHSAYKIIEIPELNISFTAKLLIAGLSIGFIAFGYLWIAKKITFLLNKISPNPIFKPFFAGLIIVIFVLLTQNYDYTGLGIEKIMASFDHQLPFYDFIAKAFFTILTLTSGFKGGEVTPLFYIGATLGNFLSTILSLSTSFLAGLGFVGIFAGVTKTPFASTFLAIELFGLEFGLYATIVCFISNFLSGKKNIYEI